MLFSLEFSNDYTLCAAASLDATRGVWSGLAAVGALAALVEMATASE